jgi:hypothetical protein
VTVINRARLALTTLQICPGGSFAGWGEGGGFGGGREELGIGEGKWGIGKK